MNICSTTCFNATIGLKIEAQGMKIAKVSVTPTGISLSVLPLAAIVLAVLPLGVVVFAVLPFPVVVFAFLPLPLAFSFVFLEIFAYESSSFADRRRLQLLAISCPFRRAAK